MNRILVLICALLVAACSSNSPPAEPSEPQVQTIEHQATFDIDGGAELRYWNVPFEIKEALNVVAVRSYPGPGVHHVVLWDMFAPGPTEPHENPNFTLFGTPFFTAGTSDGSVDYPVGYAFKMDAGSQMVAQLHGLNVSTRGPLTASIRIELDVVPGELKPVFATGIEKRDLVIPANAQGSAHETTCAFPFAMGKLFAIFPHAHALGKRMELMVGGDVIYDEPWAFDEQPIVKVDRDIAASEPITLRCTYDNPNPFDVVRGETADSEMCSIVLYSADRDYDDGLVGCLDGNIIYL